MRSCLFARNVCWLFMDPSLIFFLKSSTYNIILPQENHYFFLTSHFFDPLCSWDPSSSLPFVLIKIKIKTTVVS
jgi:hypothetical protein